MYDTGRRQERAGQTTSDAQVGSAYVGREARDHAIVVVGATWVVITSRCVNLSRTVAQNALANVNAVNVAERGRKSSNVPWVSSVGRGFFTGFFRFSARRGGPSIRPPRNESQGSFPRGGGRPHVQVQRPDTHTPRRIQATKDRDQLVTSRLWGPCR